MSYFQVQHKDLFKFLSSILSKKLYPTILENKIMSPKEK
jgi:hypothetical protein